MSSKQRSLYDRLTYAFGTDRVHAELQHLVSRYRKDPLDVVTDEGQQELFENLLLNHRRLRRMNAENRRIRKQG